MYSEGKPDMRLLAMTDLVLGKAWLIGGSTDLVVLCDAIVTLHSVQLI
jgi:hypothetical protein